MANPSSTLDSSHEKITYEKECCKNQSKFSKPAFSQWRQEVSKEILSSLKKASLIHTFANNPGQWGIKPDYFEKGPHVGVKIALMRRMPELLANLLDSLANGVSKLTIFNVNINRGNSVRNSRREM